MFRGLTSVTIDAKGRLTIPVKYREAIVQEASSALIVTIDPENRCLLLYTLPDWEKIEQKLQALPSFDRAARRIQRLLIGHATELDMDKNARVLLPQLLREYAGFDKQAMLVGQGNKFEIWGEPQWQLGREAWLAEETSQGNVGLPAELQSISL